MLRQAQHDNLKLFKRWAGKDIRLQWIKAFLRRNSRAEVFVVGGAVRDALLGRSGRKDLDLVVRGLAQKKVEAELCRLGTVNAVGRVFGVLKFVPKGRPSSGRGRQNLSPIDIALPRTDFSAGTGGYKDVCVRADARMPIEEDLSRRDFTVNAMAWDLSAGRLIDPHHGMDDLNRRVLRAVGDIQRRFQEDYSRILRAIRFAVQLGFEIEPKTWRAIKSNVKHLQDRRKDVWVVPRETIAKEFLKSFASDPVRTFDLWNESGALRLLFPEIHRMKGCPQHPAFHAEGDVWTHTRLALSILSSPAFNKEFSDGWNVETALGVLFHDIGKPPTTKTPEKHGTDRIRSNEHDDIGAQMTSAIVHRLALTSYKEIPAIDVDADRLAFLVRRHLFTVHGRIGEIKKTTLEKIFFNPAVPGRDLLKVIFCDCCATLSSKKKPTLGHFRELRKRLADLEKLRVSRPALPKGLLDGDDIMRILKLKPGKRVGEIKLALREAQLRGKVRTKKMASDFIRSLRTK